MTEKLIGKRFELFNIDGSIMVSFIISFAKEETRPTVKHSDGSMSPSHTYALVSENNAAWYQVYGGKTDRILQQ